MPQSNPASVDTVQQARTKARQRLIGAVVLLLVGIIGFPLVFETQPRPIPVDVTIEIPRKDSAPAVLAPPARSAPPASAAAPAAAASVVVRRDEPTAVPAPAAPPPARPAAASPPPAAPSAAPAAPPAAAAAPTKPAAATPAAAALVEAPGRFVVQVGAFADASAVQAIRARAERLGLKTYTQAVETVAGNRIRVRIGPFASREAAELAAAKAKSGGLSAVVLTL
jgi:DedD protein